MKRCPQCRRDYYDDSLSYCLDDGVALLEGPAMSQPAFAGTGFSSDDPQTAMLHSTASRNDSSFHLHTTGLLDNSTAIAVLPFANLSREEDSEYLSDGLAEELMNVLSKIRGLRVAARTSSFAFKGKQVSIKEIGAALQVRSVLEGSVRMAGSRVRIAVQLVDVENGFHLWSETYDRTMDDFFVVQDDIASSVVGELRKSIFRAEGDSKSEWSVTDEVTIAMKGRAANPEAQRLLLMGRYLLERLNEDDAAKAVGYFHQALDLDPTYALCWAELGRAFYAASNHGWHTLDSGYEKSEEALQRALDLDSDLAEAHARLGRIRWYRDANFIDSERCLKRALALAPDNVDVLLSAAPTAREGGQFERAIEHCGRAVAIDPLSATAWSTTAIANFLADNLTEAESAARRALELAPQRIILHACLGLILLAQGRVDEALAAALDEPANAPWRSWSLAIIYRAAGRGTDSDRELENLIAEHSEGSAFQIAEAHSVRGEIDEAFAWLERAIDQRDPGRLAAKVSPLLKPLHDDPRWFELLSKIGFPSETLDH